MELKPNKSNVKVLGRTTQIGDVLYLGFSGAYIEFETVASKVQVMFCTDKEVMEEIYRGQVAVHINDEAEPSMRFALTKPEEEITIFEAKAAQKIKLRIVKMSEAAFGIVGIKNIRIESGTDNEREGTDKEIPVQATPYKERKIEFIGDSITCGYGNEGICDQDIFCTAQENPEAAYAILTANAVDADYQLVSWSGIGIITNWVPEDVNEPLEEILMPKLYQYRDLRLCEKLKLPEEKWDYKEYQPDLIVLYLGTNDDSYVRKIPDRQEYFGTRYYAFLEQIHTCNPASAILCILGTMGQNLCEEERMRVEAFKAQYPDVKIDFMILPEQLAQDGIGTDSHPSKETHRKGADILTAKIREYMNW